MPQLVANLYANLGSPTWWLMKLEVNSKTVSKCLYPDGLTQSHTSTDKQTTRHKNTMSPATHKCIQLRINVPVKRADIYLYRLRLLCRQLTQLHCKPRRLPRRRLRLRLLTRLLHTFMLLDRFLGSGILRYSWRFRLTTRTHLSFHWFDNSLWFGSQLFRFAAWRTWWGFWATAGWAFRLCLAPCWGLGPRPPSHFLFNIPQQALLMHKQRSNEHHY